MERVLSNYSAKLVKQDKLIYLTFESTNEVPFL